MRPTLPVVVASLWLHGTAIAGCDTRYDVADLTETIDRIDEAYQSADTVAFTDGVSSLGPQLDCANEVLPRSLVARIHRTQGLAAFTQQDEGRLIDAFAAAKSIEPEFVYPESFVPPSHPLARKYADIEVGTERLPVAQPSEGFFLLDGDPADSRPAGRSVVLQHIVGRNDVALTRYLRPDDRGWSMLAPAEQPTARKGTSATPFWIASIASASLGGVMYGVAASRRAAYDNANPIDKPPLRTQTNALVATSLGLVGVGAGAAGLGLMVSR